MTNAAAYSKGILSEILDFVMGQGLIPANGEVWKTRRRAIVPSLHKCARAPAFALPASVGNTSAHRCSFMECHTALAVAGPCTGVTLGCWQHCAGSAGSSFHHIGEQDTAPAWSHGRVCTLQALCNPQAESAALGCRRYIAKMIAMFGECSLRGARLLEASAAAGTPVEMENFFSRLTLDIIGRAVFNYKFDSLTHDDPVIQVHALMYASSSSSSSSSSLALVSCPALLVHSFLALTCASLQVA